MKIRASSGKINLPVTIQPVVDPSVGSQPCWYCGFCRQSGDFLPGENMNEDIGLKRREYLQLF
jgi:hypothetical protein